MFGNWSMTAIDNQTADPEINLQEGQPAKTINNSIRSLMASLAKWRLDMNGSLLTAGSSTSYTVTTNQAVTSLYDGMTLCIRLHVACGANPVIDVDGKGAVALRSASGVNASAGQFGTGAPFDITYFASGNEWIARGAGSAGGSSGSSFGTGSVV